MILKHFYSQLLLRAGLILTTSLAIAWAVFEYNHLLLIINLLVILGVQVWLLIKTVNQTNLSLARWLESLEMEDLMFVYKGSSRSSSFDRINMSLSRISDQVRHARYAGEEKHQYFKAVTEHVNAGLVAFTPDGKIELFNRAAENITGLKYLKTIDQMKTSMPELAQLLLSIKPDDSKMLTIKMNNELTPLAIRASEIKFMNKYIKLVSLQNIKKEMDEKEMESWQQLIRILTHEIMNSTGPIISSIDTIAGFISEEGTGKPKPPDEINNEVLEDTIRGMNIVKERSRGLQDFVDKFRSLTLLPEPDIKNIGVRDLVGELKFLMKEQLDRHNVSLITRFYPQTITIPADRKSIMQVLINLAGNAIHAFKTKRDRRIEIKSWHESSGRPVIEFADNGSGIPREIKDKVFIPFFTTRDNGSGIGLSLSKQIMRQHGGTLKLHSTPGEGTVITLLF